MNENLAETEVEIALAILHNAIAGMKYEDLLSLVKIGKSASSELSWREFEMTKGEPE